METAAAPFDIIRTILTTRLWLGFCEHLLVNLPDLTGHGLMTELVRKSPLPFPAHSGPHFFVAYDLGNRLGQRIGIPRRNQESCFVVDRDLPSTVDVIANDRATGDQCLRKCSSQSFAIRCVNQGIHRTDQ